jgi:hypothetical protein
MQHDAQQQRLEELGMGMSVAIMGVARVPAAKRHTLKERVKAQTNHQPDRQSAVPMRVRVAVLDSAREVLEHHLDKKTNQNERAKIGPSSIANEYLRQQMKRRYREQVGTTEGDQQLEVIAIRRLEPQHCECGGHNGK